MKRYLVCTTPRTGSGYLCDTLWRTGLLGRPDEYFCEGGLHPDYASHHDRVNHLAYLRKASELSTTSNGVSGMKVMWEDFRDLLERYARHYPFAPQFDRSLHERLFPDAKYIWLFREDKLRQAVSVYRRQQTGTYSRRSEDQAELEPPKPDARELDALIERLNAFDRQWEQFFHRNDIAPLRMSYEEIDAHMNSALSRIARFLQIELPADGELPRSDYRRVSRPADEEWIREYERTSSA